MNHNARFPPFYALIRHRLDIWRLFRQIWHETDSGKYPESNQITDLDLYVWIKNRKVHISVCGHHLRPSEIHHETRVRLYIVWKWDKNGPKKVHRRDNHIQRPRPTLSVNLFTTTGFVRKYARPVRGYTSSSRLWLLFFLPPVPPPFYLFIYLYILGFYFCSPLERAKRQPVRTLQKTSSRK